MQARSQHPAASANEVHAVAVEDQLGFDVLDLRPALRVVQPAVMHASGDQEPAARRVGERKLAQVALQPQLHVARLAGEDAFDQPLARLLPHQRAERQVMRQVLGVGAVEHRRNVERARAIAVVGVTAEGIAAEIGIGERHRADLHLQDAAVALPIELAVQGVERKARLRKHAWQLDLGAARLQVQTPARLRRLDRAGKLGEARQRLARLEPQIEEAGAGAILRRRRDCALPFEAHVAELAARLELEREPAHVGRQRQCLGEVRERRELQRIRAHHAALPLPGELEIDRRQRRAAWRREREFARR